MGGKVSDDDICTEGQDKLCRFIYVITVCILLIGFALMELNKPVPHCKIVGDHEIVTGRCIPYCPPHPSECD